jgi:hypothetical protein
MSLEVLSIDIIILAKDNPLELQRTISSIPEHGNQFMLRPVIIDGSSFPALNHNSLASLALKFPAVSYVNSCALDISGIYPCMNYALTLISSDWFIFMNSGDTFHPDFCLEYIHGFLRSPSVSVVFGRAQIRSPFSQISWEVPSPKIKRIAAWLRYTEPSHQAMFVRKHISHQIIFDELCPVGADALWKRQVLKANRYVYVPHPIAVFMLGGASSTYSFRSLCLKLSEHSRRPHEKLMEVIKYILCKTGLFLPALQKAKSEAIGVLFS